MDRIAMELQDYLIERQIRTFGALISLFIDLDCLKVYGE